MHCKRLRVLLSILLVSGFCTTWAQAGEPTAGEVALLREQVAILTEQVGQLRAEMEGHRRLLAALAPPAHNGSTAGAAVPGAAAAVERRRRRAR